MIKLYIIRTGETIFEVQDRVEPAGSAPLSPRGVQEIQALSDELLGEKVDVIYASDGEAEKQTAELLSKPLKVKIRTIPGLREIDYGLWQGLTVKEIRRRQPKIYRQWTDAPTTVCPPGGETLEDVHGRIHKAVSDILKRHKGDRPLMVLRPVAMGLLRGMLENRSTESLWERVGRDFTWCSYEMEKNSL